MPNSWIAMRQRLRRSAYLTTEMTTTMRKHTHTHTKPYVSCISNRMNGSRVLVCWSVGVCFFVLHRCCSYMRYQLASNYPHFAHFPFMTYKSNDFCDLFSVQVQRNRFWCARSFAHSLTLVGFRHSHCDQCFVNANFGAVCNTPENSTRKSSWKFFHSKWFAVCRVWPMPCVCGRFLNMRQFKSVSFESHNKFGKAKSHKPKSQLKIMCANLCDKFHGLKSSCDFCVWFFFGGRAFSLPVSIASEHCAKFAVQRSNASAPNKWRWDQAAVLRPTQPSFMCVVIYICLT